MIPRSGFFPRATNRPQVPTFQGRHKANNPGLDLITPGDKVTLLDGKRQAVHTLDEEGNWKPVTAIRLDECKLYRVMEKTGHKGREVNGLKVPSDDGIVELTTAPIVSDYEVKVPPKASDEDDTVDYLKLQELEDNGKRPTGQIRHLLYGTFLAPNERGDNSYFKIHQLDQEGKPVRLTWSRSDLDDVYRMTEIKDGSRSFKKHNPFKLKQTEN